MATEQLEDEVLQPHIKAPVNPRPQLPQMPQHTHTLTAQPQPDQNRADHGHKPNWSHWPQCIIRIFWANTGGMSFSFHYLIVTAKMWNAYFPRSWGFCRVAVSMSECYSHHVLLPVPVCVHVSVSMCARIRISCGSDMGFGCDRRAGSSVWGRMFLSSRCTVVYWDTVCVWACVAVLLLHQTVICPVCRQWQVCTLSKLTSFYSN